MKGKLKYTKYTYGERMIKALTYRDKKRRQRRLSRRRVPPFDSAVAVESIENTFGGAEVHTGHDALDAVDQKGGTDQRRVYRHGFS